MNRPAVLQQPACRLSTATPARVKFSLPAKMFGWRLYDKLYDTKGSGAMTSDETGKTLSAFKVSRRGNLTRRREGGPEMLNPRMRRMVDFMVFGHPDDPNAIQYDIYDAAAAVGYRRKAARDLQASPIFQAAYMKALAALRNGEYARSLRTIAEIRDDRGDNKAADRKVRLHACQALLREGSGSTDFTVNVGLGQAVVPGYVIRLSEPAARSSKAAPRQQNQWEAVIRSSRLNDASVRTQAATTIRRSLRLVRRQSI